MFSLSALLRLTHYLEHNQFFPSHQDLLPHLQAEIQDHRLALQAVHDEDIALGWRSEWIFRDRLGLSVGAHRLLGNEEPPVPHGIAAPLGTPFQLSWRLSWRPLFRASPVAPRMRSAAAFLPCPFQLSW